VSKGQVVNDVSTALAGLAVLLQVFVVAIVVLTLVSIVFPPVRRLLGEIRDTLLGGEIWMAWVVALVATLGSLFFSEYANFLPCRLCWFQRICMYPMAVVLLVGALRRDARAAVQYAFVMPIVGIGVSIYHVYIEQNPSAETAACRAGGVSCTTKWIDKFGYITIPVLAMTAFATIIVLLAMAWSRRARVSVR
jgi:disulfide bond formation protein DsbB